MGFVLPTLALLLMSWVGPEIAAAGSDKNAQADAAPAGRATIAWDADLVVPAPECAKTFPGQTRSALCIVAAAPDAAGRLHLFTALWSLSMRGEGERRI